MASASSRSEGPARARDRDAPDWAAIRQAYVGHATPVRDICKAHGIHSQTLYRTADAENWPRRRARKDDAEHQTLTLLARLRRIAESQIDEIEARRDARTDVTAASEPERDARALTALAKLIEHIAAIEAKHQARRDASREASDASSPAERARRRAQLADKLIAMLEQERGAPLPEGHDG